MRDIETSSIELHWSAIAYIMYVRYMRIVTRLSAVRLSAMKKKEKKSQRWRKNSLLVSKTNV